LKELTRAYYRQLIHRINIYLEHHLHEPFGIEQLADQVCVSRHHLGDIFSAWQLEPVGAYLRRYRLEKAASLLQYTTLNLDDIAWRTGYSGKHSLSKAFSLTFDMSPGLLRKGTLYIEKAANMVMDDIRSKDEYLRILRKDFSCDYRIVRLQEYWLVSVLVRYSENPDAVGHSYGNFIRSVLADIAPLPGDDSIIKFFDAPNFTGIRQFKAEHGILVTGPVVQPGPFEAHPLRPGRYLAFDIRPGPAENPGQVITLIRENLIGHKKAFALTDFYAFYRFRRGQSEQGEYYVWLDSL
jgi:AraC-like DNA-binding protein